MEKALQVADEADKRIGEQVRHLEQTIHDATQPRVEPALAQDIRSYWRERGQSGLSAAVVADVRTASAVLSAPPYLSGLDDRVLEAINATAVRAHAPDALEEARAAHAKVRGTGARMMEVVAPRIRVWSAPANSNLTALEEYGNV